ncbi:MAG: N-6 DNA methylase, partial [Sulfurovum sp.]
EKVTPAVPKPLVFLRRILPHLQTGAMIGVVMPRSFLYADKYGEVRNTILKDFRILSITTLPDRVFTHSDAETALVVARKQPGRKTAMVLHREVRDADKVNFRLRNKVSREEAVSQTYFEREKAGRLVLPALHEVWDRLQHNETLQAVANVKTCIRYKEGTHLDCIFQTKPFPESKPGFYNITDDFMQFTGARHVFMSVKKDLMRDEGEILQHEWNKPKIILPASRMSRGHWRFAAAIDTKGRLLNRRFYAVWPKNESVDVKVLAALLNAPLAQAFVYCHQTERDILINQYEAIPTPPLSTLVESGAVIGALVSRYMEQVGKDVEDAVATLMRIDAEVMRMYKLPPRLERQILDLFWGESRRVDVQFNGYIPPDFKSWIPLHVFISDKFRDSTAANIMGRIPMIEDREFIDYLKKLGTE